MSRLIFDQRQRLGTAGSQYGKFYQPVGSKVNVYQFRKVSGYIRMTTFGEQNIYTSTNDYQQVTNVYTGQKPIVVVGNGSTKLWVLEDKRSILKEVKVGKYFTMYSTGANINTLETSEINLLGKDYVNTYISKDIILESPEGNPNNDDINEYVYLILDPINKSLQGLEIQEVIPVYNEENKEFSYSQITFNNVNLKYAKTGKSILDFIQFGAIGEGYCFPKETTLENGDIEVTLEEEKITPNNQRAVKQFQFDFNGSVALNNVMFIGRRPEKIIDGKIYVEPPYYLFPYRINFPKSSDFLYLQPNANSFCMVNALPVKKEVGESYKDAYKGNNRIGEYNILNTKQVLTGLKIDNKSVLDSNAILNGSYSYINGDNKLNVNLVNPSYDFDAIPYCKTFSLTGEKKFTYAEFLAFNYFVSFYDEAINFTFEETTKYKLTDTVGILGPIVNFFIGGLNIGGTNTASLAPKQPHNFLVPCISYLDGKAALSDESPVPCEIFIDDKTKSVLPTSTNVLSSGNITMSNKIRDTSQVYSTRPVGKGGQGIGYTIYLGQTKFEDGTGINADHSPFKIDGRYTSVLAPDQGGFIIDEVLYKVVGACDVRLSAYSIADKNVYTSFSQTIAKARNEITLGNNQIKFNYYDEFNTAGQVDGPENVNGPLPTGRKYRIPQLSDINDVWDESYDYLKLNTANVGVGDPFSGLLDIRYQPATVINRVIIPWYFHTGDILTNSIKFSNTSKRILFDFSLLDLELYDKIEFEWQYTDPNDETKNATLVQTYNLKVDGDNFYPPEQTDDFLISRKQDYPLEFKVFKNRILQRQGKCSIYGSDDPSRVPTNGGFGYRTQMDVLSNPINLKLSPNGVTFEIVSDIGNIKRRILTPPDAGIEALDYFYCANDETYETTINNKEFMKDFVLKNTYLILK